MIESNLEGRVVELVLAAPERLNAVGADDLDALATAVAQAQSRFDAGEIGALLLRGDGRAFCSGRDISGVDPAEDDVLGYLEGSLGETMRRLAEFPGPTFAAVQGACLGVGLGLALACDVVYVAEHAKLGSPFANLGATLDSGGHWLFAERLGPHRTLDLIYTAELMSGREAVEQGLFSRWVADDELLTFTRERAQRAASGASRAFAASKQLVRQIRDERIGLWESIAAENLAQADLCSTEDYREGFAAFQQKRRPNFTGQ
ncbi:enoyl-CoA hydratase/isomerase family protein [Gulosibacter faecalis]|jgi:enoyl-CoA hydratase/carnithine racemase|uniref:Enoyl-CoA hydratase/isomerase family protein n=1 Tax=Gulosibacter faecalis TaxID=272240 RepID=A0ABW5UZU6_9MICO|nr:enoyl-CoA hydratase-related protein [Gulosibacter faecalis]